MYVHWGNAFYIISMIVVYILIQHNTPPPWCPIFRYPLLLIGCCPPLLWNTVVCSLTFNIHFYYTVLCSTGASHCSYIVHGICLPDVQYTTWSLLSWRPIHLCPRLLLHTCVGPLTPITLVPITARISVSTLPDVQYTGVRSPDVQHTGVHYCSQTRIQHLTSNILVSTTALAYLSRPMTN